MKTRSTFGAALAALAALGLAGLSPAQADPVNQVPVAQADPVNQVPVAQADPVNQVPVAQADPVNQVPVVPATVNPAPVTPVPAQAAPSTTETLILIRHGEKTPTEFGQLDDEGLNRSLALPEILIGKYGKPDFIFAPNPSAQIGAGHGKSYSYVRPLATIEPTAIHLGMPVNTQIGFGDIKGLEAELIKPKYAAAMVFIAWEHGMEDEFAKHVMTDYSQDPSVVPNWGGNDYDSIFVLRLTHTGTAITASFSHDYEGLNGKLSTAYPVLAPAPTPAP